MAELSTLGRAALYEHMVEALASHGTGRLNKHSLQHSSDVSDEDLRTIINIVCETGDYPKPDIKSQDRTRLVDTLGNLLDQVSLMPGIAVSVEEPTLRGHHDDGENPSLLQPQSERAHAIAQGQSGNVNRRVLHAARVAAGWKSHTMVGAGNTAGRKILYDITEAYLQKQRKRGLSDEDAHKQMEREYIAHHDTYAKGGFVSHYRRQRLNDSHAGPQPTQHHIDLSPQAIEDFNHAMQQRQEEKSQGSDVYNLFTRYGMKYDHTLARKVVREAWEEEVSKIQEEGMLRGAAERKASKEYLDRNTNVVYLELGRNLSPRAYNDIENAIIAISLEREKLSRS